MGANILDFYRGSIPRGTGLIKRVSWTNLNTTTLTLTPSSGFVAYVSTLVIAATDTFDLGAASIVVEPWGQDIPPQVSIRDLLGLYAVATHIGEKDVIIGGTGYHWFRIDFKPFPVLVQSDGDTFTVSHSVGETAAITGEVRFTAVAHEVLAADA